MIQWFLLHNHFIVKCTVFGVKDCTLEQLDTFASLSGYQLTDDEREGRRYECKQIAGREMVLHASDIGGWEPDYVLEWNISRSP